MAYNLDFDLRMIKQSIKAYDRKDIENAISHISGGCIMKLFSKFHGEWDNYRAEYKYKKLADAAEILGIPVVESHTALEDTMTAYNVFRKMTDNRTDNKG
jgi:DNA polymerase III epsilon subunit-like protein